MEWISCLYANVCFWHGQKRELTVTFDQDCIWNGELVSWTDGEIDCEMKWKGYFSQIYDGQFKMTPLTPEASIEGTVEKSTFAFDGVAGQVSSVYTSLLSNNSLSIKGEFEICSPS